MLSMEYSEFMNPPWILSLLLFICSVFFRVWVYAKRDPFSGPNTALYLRMFGVILTQSTGLMLLFTTIASLPPSLVRSLLEPLIPTLRNLLFSIREFLRHTIGLMVRYRILLQFYPAMIFGCCALISLMRNYNIFAWIVSAYLLAAIHPLSFNAVMTRTFYRSLLTFIGSGVFTLWISTGRHHTRSPSKASLMLAFSKVLIRVSGVVLTYMITLKLSPLPHENLIFLRDLLMKFAKMTMNDRKLWPLYPAASFGSYAIMHSVWSRSEYPWIFAAALMAGFSPTPDNTTSRFIFYGSEILFAFIAFILSVVSVKLNYPNCNAWKLYCAFAIIYTISIVSYCIVNYRKNHKEIKS